MFRIGTPGAALQREHSTGFNREVSVRHKTHSDISEVQQLSSHLHKHSHVCYIKSMATQHSVQANAELLHMQIMPGFALRERLTYDIP